MPGQDGHDPGIPFVHTGQEIRGQIVQGLSGGGFVLPASRNQLGIALGHPVGNALVLHLRHDKGPRPADKIEPIFPAKFYEGFHVQIIPLLAKVKHPLFLLMAQPGDIGGHCIHARRFQLCQTILPLLPL